MNLTLDSANMLCAKHLGMKKKLSYCGIKELCWYFKDEFFRWGSSLSFESDANDAELLLEEVEDKGWEWLEDLSLSNHRFDGKKTYCCLISKTGFSISKEGKTYFEVKGKEKLIVRMEAFIWWKTGERVKIV